MELLLLLSSPTMVNIRRNIRSVAVRGKECGGTEVVGLLLVSQLGMLKYRCRKGFKRRKGKEIVSIV